MPPKNLTIAALSQPRNRPPTQPQAPLTSAEKKEKQLASAETKAEMDAAVAEVQSYIKNKAVDLGKHFDKQPRYFLDIFYQAGARMVHAQEKTNPYNAFKSEKAAQARDEGRALKAPELHAEYWAEYEAMTEQEKKDLVERFDKEVKNEIPKLRRDTPMARIRDFSNTMKNIEQLMHGLSYRVGMEGLFVVVRNTTDFHIEPRWYFTSPELERYLPIAVGRKWDQGSIGPKLEAFAIAGCDTINLLRTARQKAAFLKTEIRDLVGSGLVKITGRQIDMEYLHHEESIVLRYGVELVGWTADKFVNPSELSSSLGVLTTLRDALKNGECKWVKLSRDDRRARQAKWDEGVAAGTIIPRARATRSDKGQPRKRKHTEVDNDIDADNETPDGMATVSSGTSSAVPGTTTSPIVTSPPASQAAPGAPAPKRRKTNGVAASPPAAGNKAPRKPRAKPSKENDGAKSGKGKGKGKPAAGSKKVRDDETTRKVLVELRARRVAKSRAVILSDDEEDSEPTASTSTTADVPAAPATPATPDAIDPALLTMAAA